MKLIPKDTWETMWRDIKVAGARMSLNQYSDYCDKTKDAWAKKWPGVSFSNGRYEVHVEEALQRGVKVPDGVIAGLPHDCLQYDYSAFPCLAPKLGYTIRPVVTTNAVTEYGLTQRLSRPVRVF